MILKTQINPNSHYNMKFEIVPENSGIQESEKHSLEIAFAGFFAEASKWQAHAATIEDPKLARVARLELKKLRVDAEKKRKQMGEDSLRMTKAINGANNILLALIVPIEKSLEEIENAAEIAEKARILSVFSDRSEKLRYLEYFPILPDLGEMGDDEWSKTLEMALDVKTLRDKRKAKELKEAEEKAKKDALDRENQRLENIQLKLKADKLQKEMEAERLKSQEARLKVENELAIERKRIADEKIKSEAIAKIAEVKLAEANKVIDEKAMELKLQREAEEAKVKELSAAPDKEKLKKFANDIRLVTFPELTDLDGSNIKLKQEGFAVWIEKQIYNL